MVELLAIRSVGRVPPGAWIEYYQLSGGVLVGTYVLMQLGAYTSAIGAGLSCPDWPTCYGTFVPFLHSEIISHSLYTVL